MEKNPTSSLLLNNYINVKNVFSFSLSPFPEIISINHWFVFFFAWAHTNVEFSCHAEDMSGCKTKDLLYNKEAFISEEFGSFKNYQSYLYYKGIWLFYNFGRQYIQPKVNLDTHCSIFLVDLEVS